MNSVSSEAIDQMTSVLAAKGKVTNKSKNRKSASLPPETVEYLKNWIMSPEHIAHPYPTEQEKAKIMEDTGIEMKQLTNWFVNNRKRFWKPRVEAKIREQRKAGSSLPLKPEVRHEPVVEAVTSTNGTNNNDSTSSLSLVDLVTQMHARETSNPQTPRRVSTGSLVATAPAKASLVSPWSVISSQPSSSAEDNSISSEDQQQHDDDASSGQETEEILYKREDLTLYICHPSSGGVPSINDVNTTLGGNVCRTFMGLTLRYQGTADELRERRQNELESMKRECLAMYSKEQEQASKADAEKKRNSVSEGVISISLRGRRKFRRVSIETWKMACQTAEDVYDDQLPSLEEAATLFGYSAIKA